MKKNVILATILLLTMGFLCAQVTPSSNPDSCQLIQRFDTLVPVQEVEISPITCPTFVASQYHDVRDVFYATVQDTLGAGPDVYGFLIYLLGEDAYGNEARIYKGYVSNGNTPDAISFALMFGAPAIVTNSDHFTPYLYALPDQRIALVPYMYYTGEDCVDTIFGPEILYTLPEVACPRLGNVTVTPQMGGSLLLRTPILDYDSQMVDSTAIQYIIRYPDASWVTENAVISGNELTLSFVPALGATGAFKFAARMNLSGICALIGDVTVFSDTVDYTLVPCPDFDGPIYVISSPDGLRDTIAVGLAHYNESMVGEIRVTVRIAGQEDVIATGTMQVNAAGTLAKYDVGDWAAGNLLSQYGLTPGDTLTYRVVATMVMEEGVMCSAVAQDSVTMGVPECPAFNHAGAAVTTLFTLEDRSIDVTYPVEHYLSALVYDDPSAFQMKWYKESVYQGVIPATYNPSDHSLHATLPKANIAQGRRYDFAPTMKLIRYCNSGGTAFQLVEGDTVGVVFPALCTQYGSATTAVLNIDSSITLTHPLVNYDTDLFEGAAAPVFYIYVDGVQKAPLTAEIDSNGVMRAVITASQLQPLNAMFAFEGKTLTFVPRFYMGSYCADPGTGPVSNGICYPFNTSPGFVANSTALTLNESNNSVSMTVGVSDYAVGRIVSYLFRCCTNNCGQGGSGWLDVVASWNGAHNAFSATRTFNYPGDTLMVIPFMVVDHGCAGLDTLYGALAQVAIPLCPSYGDSTTVVLNSDGTITVSHAIENYRTALVQGNPFFSMYVQGVASPTMVAANVSAVGVMTAVLPAATVSALAGKSLTFAPVMSLLNGCNDQLSAAPTAEVCVPLPSNMKPSFSGVTNTSGEEKLTLFPNEGVILRSKIVNYDNFSDNIARKGYLLSLNSIDEYDPTLAIDVEVSGVTNDTLWYKVGLDSCGLTVYYRPFVILSNTCDSVVLGEQKSFHMWIPEFTISANPAVTNGTQEVALHAVATMTVGTFCNATHSMEEWISLEWVDTSTCMITYMGMTFALSSAYGLIQQMMTNTYHITADNWRYEWRANDILIHQSSSTGDTTDTPAQTTTYTAYGIFDYNGKQCIAKDSVTVTVNP